MFFIWIAITLVCTPSEPIPPSAELEIQASLTGFNLMPGSRRCCAFDLHLAPTGELTTTLRLYPDPATAVSRLPHDELASLRRVLQDARFFELPPHVGEIPVDGDKHRMQVRLGARSHTVTLHAWPDDWDDSVLSQKELEDTRRAYSLWSALRSLIEDPRARVP